MPFTISNPVLGYVGFCAVKFAGYSLAGRVFSDRYRRPDCNPFVVWSVRTLIGMVAGAAFYGTLHLLSIETGPFIFISLVPVRLVEWWLIVWLFYDRQLQHCAKDWGCVTFGTVWSFVLDVPAAYGFFITSVVVC